MKIEDTTMTRAAESKKALIATLNRCIEAATDAEKGYAVAAGDVRDEGLKMLLQQRSDERARCVIALQRIVTELGGWAESEGSVEGALHRAWIETRLAVEGRSDATVLSECLRGERRSAEVFNMLAWKVANDATLPESARTLVLRERDAVLAAVDDLTKRVGAIV